MHEKIKRIADLYGWFHQSLKLIEEMAELIVATIKLMLHIRTEQMWKNYIEELADVQIMLHQLIYLSNKKREVEEAMEEKVQRQILRIEEAGIRKGERYIYEPK